MQRCAALAVAVLLVAGGCGPSNHGGRPLPSPKGQPIGRASALAISIDGGSVSSADGVLTVTIPSGSLTAPVDVTVDEITATAPGKVGTVAYRISPATTILAAPMTLVFHPSPAAPSLQGLTVAYQENQGFWLRQRDVLWSATDGTLSVTTTHFGDWSLVTGSPDDLHGNVTVVSTMNPPLSATGVVTLNAAGGDASGTYYLQWGTLTLASTSLASGTRTCDAVPPGSADLDTNIAEVTSNPAIFRWGMTARWPLTCSDAGGPAFADLASLFFDTMGIYRPGCARSYAQAPLVTSGHLQGTYTIDCGTDGAVTTTWDMLSCTPGLACGGECRLGSTSCATGFSVCVDGGPVTDGTACSSGVCSAGTCVPACVAGQPCAPAVPDACLTYSTTCNAALTTTTCSVAAPKPNGTTCSGGVCSAGACVAACVAGQPCAPANPDSCLTYSTACDATLTTTTCGVAAPQPDGTACTGGVCSAGACVAACVAGQPCAPANPDPCLTYSTTCDATLTKTTCSVAAPQPDGTSCTGGVCSAGACVAACVAGVPCTPTTTPDPCQIYSTTCDASLTTTMCSSAGPQPDGTACTGTGGAAGTCTTGVCSAP